MMNGEYKCTSKQQTQRKNRRESFADLVAQGDEAEVAEYFGRIYAEYPDALTAAEVAEMTGLSKHTILRCIKSGDIKLLGFNNKNYTTKQYVMDFAVSKRFIDCKSSSEALKKLLRGFELWRAGKLENNTYHVEESEAIQK